jgi:tetratricopeptide (TPR) repeat protein
MPEAHPTPIGLPHVVFLERAARETDVSHGRFGQAAFLVLRLVDLLSDAHDPGPNDDLFGYQAAATGRYCSEQLEPGAPAACLQEVVRSASYAHRRRAPALIAPAMLALAASLETGASYLEALDVLATLDRVAAAGIVAAHAVSVALQSGRVHRRLARFDEADAAYERAATLASESGDADSVLLSRLGRANVFWGRGNLAEAERWNREALRDAQASTRAVQALAEHGLAVVLGARGQVPDAIPHLWQAFRLYEGEGDSLQALFDLGFALSRLGAVDGAERALRIVRQRSPMHSLVQNAKIELMHCASFRGDRIGFERYRGECDEESPRMAPNVLADYRLKLGIGFARFGYVDRAVAEMERAHEIARSHGLHEFEFRIERIRAGIAACTPQDLTGETPAEQPGWAATVATVSTALAGLSD